jgi:hypothetical protein
MVFIELKGVAKLAREEPILVTEITGPIERKIS